MDEEKNTYFHNGAEHQDRRRFPRLTTTVDVQYSIIKGHPDMIEAVSKNIAAGGICLIVYEKIEPASLLDLQIYISDIDYKIKAKGKVIWVSPFSVGQEQQERYDAGIELIEIDEADRQRLAEYVFRLT